MKKYIILLIFIFNSLLVNSQIDLLLSVKYQSINNGSRSEWDLSICDSRTYFEKNNTNTDVNKNNQNSLTLQSTGSYFFVKEKAKKSIFYTEIINKKVFLVKDSIDVIKWKLSSNSKTILGYKCLSATTTFRGRSYTAYYTPSLAISDGPFKFGGLPGLILEIESDDKEYSYKAFKIIKGEARCINGNFESKSKNTFMNFEEFKKIFKNEIDLIVKKLKSQETEDDLGNSSYYKYNKLEIIYPEAQLGEGIVF